MLQNEIFINIPIISKILSVFNLKPIFHLYYETTKIISFCIFKNYILNSMYYLSFNII